MRCVFDSRPAETFVKFCPAKPGVVWSILSLENFNFCNAGFHCQCFVFMHLLHPNPTPNSICLEPSCCHVNQTSSPCHWTCRHRCGQQFHSRRPGCGNILARFFEIVSGADGEWSPEGAKQIKLWMEIELGVFDIDIYIYIDMHFAPLFMFLPLVHFLQFAEARRCHRNCPKYFARSAVAWQDIALQRPPPL